VSCSRPRPKCHGKGDRSIKGTLNLRLSPSDPSAAHNLTTAHRSRTAAGPSAGRRLIPVLLLACAFVLGGGATVSGAGVVTVTSPDGLNLRDAPTTSSTVVAVVPLGTVLSLIGAPTSDLWYPVSYGSQNGWAYGAYLTPGQVNPLAASNAPALAANAPLTPPVQPTLPSSASVAPASTPALNAQSGPASTGAPATAAQGAGGTSSSGNSSGTMMVNTNLLNVRSAPSLSSAVVTAVPQGTAVQVVGSAVNNWVPVNLNGINGWMDSTYLASNAALSAGLGFGPVDYSRPLSATMFGNPTLGTGAGPETGETVATLPPGTSGKFVWPVMSRRITTKFQAIHQAIDIDQYPAGGNPAVATADGIVSYAGGDACCSYGLYVIVQHKDGFSSLYSHLSKVEVTQGQLVHQNQELGLTGNTGNSTGPHIHFALYYNGQPFDPLSVLPSGADVWPGS
jgi:murein DD-endopeptidase MepM/ murein hydrolase activator NlpD